MGWRQQTSGDGGPRGGGRGSSHRSWGKLLISQFFAWRYNATMEKSDAPFVKRFGRFLLPGLFQALLLMCVERALAADDSYLNLQPLKPGDHALHILSPRLLELDLVNTKQPAPAPLDSWDWVNTNGDFAPPSLSSLRVVVNGRTNTIT